MKYDLGGIMAGKGKDLGIAKAPVTKDIPRQSPAPTKTGSQTGKHFDIKKKMRKVMKHISMVGSKEAI